MSNPSVSYFPNLHLVLHKQFEEINSTDENYFRLMSRISCGVIDSDYHIMGDSTLKNFARDASNGVQVKDSHMRKNGFGKTSNGKYIEDKKETIAQLTIRRDMPLSSDASYPMSNGFIMAIESEIITEVSVGAYGGELVCRLCNQSMFRSSECTHWPGIEYDIIIDDKKERKLCTAEYINGKLREVSFVDKGACPGAEILLRLDNFIKKGIIPDKDIILVKAMYSIPNNTDFSFSSSEYNNKKVSNKTSEQSKDIKTVKSPNDISNEDDYDIKIRKP